MALIETGNMVFVTGDASPVFCYCGVIYQPDAKQKPSTCPKCGHESGQSPTAEHLAARQRDTESEWIRYEVAR